MNGVELFLLGRSLMKIGEAALPADSGGSERTVLIVLDDIVNHTRATVSGIARRTGLPQSAVSAAVARLGEAGAVTFETDSQDRRRTIIRVAPRASERVKDIRATTINHAVAAAITSEQPNATRDVIEALEVIARHLRPRGA